MTVLRVQRIVKPAGTASHLFPGRARRSPRFCCRFFFLRFPSGGKFVSQRSRLLYQRGNGILDKFGQQIPVLRTFVPYTTDPRLRPAGRTGYGTPGHAAPAALTVDGIRSGFYERIVVYLLNALQQLPAGFTLYRVCGIIKPAFPAADPSFGNRVVRGFVRNDLRQQLLSRRNRILPFRLRMGNVPERHPADFTHLGLPGIGMPAVGTADLFLGIRIQDRFTILRRRVLFREEFPALLTHNGILRILKITFRAAHGSLLSP